MYPLIDSPRFLGFLGLRADEVAACSLGPDLLKFDDRASLFFLGQANEVVVLYDSEADETLRVPSTEIVMVDVHNPLLRAMEEASDGVDRPVC